MSVDNVLPLDQPMHLFSLKLTIDQTIFLLLLLLLLLTLLKTDDCSCCRKLFLGGRSTSMSGRRIQYKHTASWRQWG